MITPSVPVADCGDEDLIVLGARPVILGDQPTGIGKTMTSAAPRRRAW
jgi:hypothetical protein